MSGTAAGGPPLEGGTTLGGLGGSLEDKVTITSKVTSYLSNCVHLAVHQTCRKNSTNIIGYQIKSKSKKSNQIAKYSTDSSNCC